MCGLVYVGGQTASPMSAAAISWASGGGLPGQQHDPWLWAALCVGPAALEGCFRNELVHLDSVSYLGGRK